MEIYIPERERRSKSELTRTEERELLQILSSYQPPKSEKQKEREREAEAFLFLYSN